MKTNSILTTIVATATLLLITGCGNKDEMPVVEGWSGRDRKEVEAGKYNPKVMELREQQERETAAIVAKEKAALAAKTKKIEAPKLKLTKAQMPLFMPMNPTRETTVILALLDEMSSETKNTTAAALLMGELATTYIVQGEYERAIPYADKNTAILGESIQKYPQLTLDMAEACYRQAFLKLYERKDQLGAARAFEAMALGKSWQDWTSTHPVITKYENLHKRLVANSQNQPVAPAPNKATTTTANITATTTTEDNQTTQPDTTETTATR